MQWKDVRPYINIVPSVFAVINGGLAFWLSGFLKGDDTARLAVLAVVVLLSGLAIAATIYNQSRIEKDKAEDAARRHAIKERLGEFIDQGHALLHNCAQPATPIPSAAGDSWAATVESYLLSNLGASYVPRFRSGAGLPLTANSIVDLDRRNLWAAIWLRVARLEQFSSEVPF